MPLLVSLALLMPAVPAGCGLSPVDGHVVSGFAPGPGYGGHWGIDYHAEVGAPVRAVAGGTVTFAGIVVENRVVTVNHGGSVRTSYSFLAAIATGAGEVVTAGDLLGFSGMAHGLPGLHFSLRVGDQYRDPAAFLRCEAVPHHALRLLGRGPSGSLYAVARAERDPGRHVRPHSCCAPHGGRGGAQSSRIGRRHLYHRR